MKKYDSYKDSGIEWIGELPSHWKNTRIKFTVNEKNSLFIDGDWIESKVITEEGIRYITTGNVKVGYYSEQGNGYISNQTFTDLNCTEVFEGDLILSRLNNPIGRACIVPNLNSRIVTSVDNVIYRPDSNLSKRYLLYLFSSKEYFEHTDLISRGATMQRISRGMLGNLKIPLPDINEQNTIANYLDQKTSQIDDLIAKKERLIQLLEEERTAIINQAVTKGLDPTVPMKDSGIEWLGEIPSHWEVTSLKRLIEVKDGTHDTPNYVEEGIPFITTKDIIKKEISFSQCKFITYEDYEKINKRSDVCIGDIIMPMIGSIGSPIIVNTDTPFSIKNLALIKNNSNCDIRFIRYYLDSELTMFQFELNTSGGVQNFVSLGSLRNLKIPKLTKEEQIKIADFLDFKENQFEECINKINNEIKLLKEYKTALISEVVTGKVDVRYEKLN